MSSMNADTSASTPPSRGECDNAEMPAPDPSLITFLYVTDLDASHAFYADALGLPTLAGHLAQAVRERAAQARALLPGVFRTDAGAEPSAWQRLLESRRAALPPQALPRGWLTATRSAP